MKRTGITYGQLDKALRSLGFTCRLDKAEPPARIYTHKSSGAVLTFPAFPKRDRMLEYHLVATRFLLDQFGIAIPAIFATELQAAG